jgi:hypothetical protein
MGVGQWIERRPWIWIAESFEDVLDAGKDHAA